ncbi:single-stranded DNA-binding protein [Flavobacterium aurantiibacter]|uniref:Single-stranded DNA-binding protein n=1 Tax=Flavobacterium aurantiibacter TaxID=2023067 RepID=A0A255ZPI7_9FLAO|nr:single-stranded DNA-binding protein [Flavobacterium aurantiibacter]OYQ43331.1 single-stranded DNA-binding protein [Flavobacterium aurantiibacter]
METIIRNRVILRGHAGSDAKVKTFDSNRKIATISIATNESYTNRAGDKVEETSWHRVIAFGKLADLAEQHVLKGKEIGIEGKLSSRSYEDAAGNRRYVTEIIANEITVHSKKEEEAKAEN